MFAFVDIFLISFFNRWQFLFKPFFGNQDKNFTFIICRMNDLCNRLEMFVCYPYPFWRCQYCSLICVPFSYCHLQFHVVGPSLLSYIHILLSGEVACKFELKRKQGLQFDTESALWIPLIHPFLQSSLLLKMMTRTFLCPPFSAYWRSCYQLPCKIVMNESKLWILLEMLRVELMSFC